MIAVVLSTIVNLFVLIMLFVQGPRLGVDFSGGTVVQLKFMQKVVMFARCVLHWANWGPETL